mmetsp:Transcript_23063/g.52978  ORF Transcript_23063/g.52978 Transcript_23063/m.52978 type:complete len:106 (-) Transcript_23063:301-618(-)
MQSAGNKHTVHCRNMENVPGIMQWTIVQTRHFSNARRLHINDAAAPTSCRVKSKREGKMHVGKAKTIATCECTQTQIKLLLQTPFGVPPWVASKTKNDCSRALFQ